MGDRCRSKYHCVGHTSDGPAVTGRDSTLCPGCVDAIQKSYNELPFLADALRTMKGGSMEVSYEPRVSGSREPAVPLDLTVVCLLEDIENVQALVDGYLIRDLIMQPKKDFLMWVREVQQFLLLDGVDRALRVSRVHRRASHAVGLAPVRHRRIYPCPSCTGDTLGQWSGTEYVDCSNVDCALKMSLEQYEDYCWTLIKEGQNDRKSRRR